MSTSDAPESATTRNAVATPSESAPAVVAHKALSPPASGGAPDLRELEALRAYVSLLEHGAPSFPPVPGEPLIDMDVKREILHRLDAALSSSVSPKGAQ